MKKIAIVFLAVFVVLGGSLSSLAEEAETTTELVEAEDGTEAFVEIEEGTEAFVEIEDVTEAFVEIEDVTEAEEEVELEEEGKLEEAAEEATEAEGENAIVPEISMQWVNCYVNKSLTVLQNRVMYIDGALFLPAEEAATLLGMECESVDYSEGITALKLVYGDNEGYFFRNSYYAVINGEALDMERPAYLIEDVLYIPSEIFADVFGVEQSLDTTAPDPDLYLTAFADEAGLKYAERVNALKLQSDTDYLIWICKSDFSLRLFKKSSAGWVFQKEFECAIGAPSTPTCEGIYKFYERVSRWSYSTYYVGPIMRFNGGFAIHSTLINYDGTPRDNRVGVKISHGCVRLRPEDINYLYKVIPLYTTIYISAN